MEDLEHARQHFAASIQSLADAFRDCAQKADVYAKLVNGAGDPLHDDSAKGKRKAQGALDDADGPKKRKRSAKPKDPLAPKRPASSYILFQNEVRKKLKEKHPDITNADLLAMIAEKWKHLPEEQKERYNQQMKTAKLLYSEEKKAYENRTPEEIEAANNAAAAGAAAAAATKKANKSRASKPAPAPATATVAPAVQPAADESPEEDESDEDESDEDASPQHNGKDAPEASSEEESEQEEVPEPPKKRRAGSVQPPKTKKTGKV